MTRVEFILHYAALATLFLEEATRTTTDGRTLHQLTRTAAEPSRLEWLFNFRRFKERLSPWELEYLPTGTTKRGVALRAQPQL